MKQIGIKALCMVIISSIAHLQNISPKDVFLTKFNAAQFFNPFSTIANKSEVIESFAPFIAKDSTVKIEVPNSENNPAFKVFKRLIAQKEWSNYIESSNTLNNDNITKISQTLEACGFKVVSTQTKSKILHFSSFDTAKEWVCSWMPFSADLSEEKRNDFLKVFDDEYQAAYPDLATKTAITIPTSYTVIAAEKIT